jgi:hypothetical protein
MFLGRNWLQSSPVQWLPIFKVLKREITIPAVCEQSCWKNTEAYIKPIIVHFKTLFVVKFAFGFCYLLELADGHYST